MDNPDYRRIEQAIAFLEQHALEQPSLEQVAEHIGLSTFHFQRLFKSWAGVSPKRFLQYLTIGNAKRMLNESSSVLDTALDIGLSGPGRLHDLFVSVEALTPGEYKALGENLTITYGFHPSPFGECLLATTKRGICNLSFIDPDIRSHVETQLACCWPAATLIRDDAVGQEIITQIFTPASTKKTPAFNLMLRGTNFQIKVWEALLRIPEGTATTYAALAAEIGHPKAHRAVGSAVGKNPIAYLIPCHRVLRTNGDIGGYHWGTTRKRAILAREAALCAPAINV